MCKYCLTTSITAFSNNFLSFSFLFFFLKCESVLNYFAINLTTNYSVNLVTSLFIYVHIEIIILFYSFTLNVCLSLARIITIFFVIFFFCATFFLFPLEASECLFGHCMNEGKRKIKPFFRML